MSEDPPVRSRGLAIWGAVLTMGVAVAVAAILGLAGDPTPELAYLLTDPVGLAVVAFSFASAILSTGAFIGHPFTPRPPPGAPPPPKYWALRALAALLAVVVVVALRFAIMHGATPVRLAVDAVRLHPAAAMKLGQPVEIGWELGGAIHASGSENDEPMPARIDASVDVHGPKGSGTLVMEGQAVGSRWVFERLTLTMDSGERVDIVPGSRRPRAPSDTLATLALIGGGVAALGGLIALVVLLLLRGTDPARALVSMEIPPGAPFTLRFTPRGPRAHHLWLRFELDWDGGEDDYGVTAEITIEVPGRGPMKVEHRMGDKAPSIGPSGARNTTLYRATSSSGPAGESVLATAKIAAITPPEARGEVLVGGRLVLGPGSTSRGLLLFVSPG